jgi:predicted DCC family thiol-disulfide oxidoreductase YuxK
VQKFKKKSIILFDGVCNLCNSSVNFIIKHDKKNQFLFASLQSDAAKDLMLHYGIKNYNTATILLIEQNKVYHKSTAVLKIANHLNNGLTFCYIFIIIPKSMRDLVYDFIAKRRYKCFGKRESCMKPSLELKNRFLD